MRTVLITGVNGFLGSHLAADLAKRGFRVTGSTSSEAGLRRATPGVERKGLLRFGGPWDPDIVRGVDTVIHCAWDLRPAAAPENIAGTTRLAGAAQEAGATHQIFISTYSAHPSAVSSYGKSKLSVQAYMLDRGHAVARPGLVIGPGGLFQRVYDTLTRRRFVPLLDGGRASVPIVGIRDLQDALVGIVERRLTGLLNLFNPDLVTLKHLMLEIRAAAARRTLLVPVPSALLLGPVWLMGRAGITLPINVDNLRGLRANVNVGGRSDLPAFVPRPLTLAEMVRAASQIHCEPCR
jgi:nucleoside-diphosphate-sugar epimerase